MSVGLAIYVTGTEPSKGKPSGWKAQPNKEKSSLVNDAASRDLVLTCQVPPAQQDSSSALCLQQYAAKVTNELGVTSFRHLKRIVQQLLESESVQGVATWSDIIPTLAANAAQMLSAPAIAARGALDPRKYVKVKKLPGMGVPADSCAVSGVVFRKNVAHRKMRSHVLNPRIVMLGCALESDIVPTSLLSFDNQHVQQESRHLESVVEGISKLQADVVVVQKSVARVAQERLLEQGVTVVLNVKSSIMNRLAHCTGCQIAASLDQLSPHCVARCEEFSTEALPMPQAGGSHSADSKRGSTVRSARTLMLFRGPPHKVAATVLLKGASFEELICIKRVVQFAVFAAYALKLENSFLGSLVTNCALSSVSTQQPGSIELQNSAARAAHGMTAHADSDEHRRGKQKHKRRSSNVEGSSEHCNGRADAESAAETCAVCASNVDALLACSCGSSLFDHHGDVRDMLTCSERRNAHHQAGPLVLSVSPHISRHFARGTISAMAACRPRTHSHDHSDAAVSPEHAANASLRSRHAQSPNKVASNTTASRIPRQVTQNKNNAEHAAALAAQHDQQHGTAHPQHAAMSAHSDQAKHARCNGVQHGFDMADTDGNAAAAVDAVSSRTNRSSIDSRTQRASHTASACGTPHCAECDGAHHAEDDPYSMMSVFELLSLQHGLSNSAPPSPSSSPFVLASLDSANHTSEGLPSPSANLTDPACRCMAQQSCLDPCYSFPVDFSSPISWSHTNSTAATPRAPPTLQRQSSAPSVLTDKHGSHLHDMLVRALHDAQHSAWKRHARAHTQPSSPQLQALRDSHRSPSRSSLHACDDDQHDEGSNHSCSPTTFTHYSRQFSDPLRRESLGLSDGEGEDAGDEVEDAVMDTAQFSLRAAQWAQAQAQLYYSQRIYLTGMKSALSPSLVTKPTVLRIDLYGQSDTTLSSFLRAASAKRLRGDTFQLVNMFLHGSTQVQIYAADLQSGEELSGADSGTVWFWSRPVSQPSSPCVGFRLPLPPDACCLTLGHFLDLCTGMQHMQLGDSSLSTDYLHYFGVGNKVVCVWSQSIAPFDMHLPPSQIEFDDAREQNWLANEAVELMQDVNEMYDVLEAAARRVASMRAAADSSMVVTAPDGNLVCLQALQCSWLRVERDLLLEGIKLASGSGLDSTAKAMLQAFPKLRDDHVAALVDELLIALEPMCKSASLSCPDHVGCLQRLNCVRRLVAALAVRWLSVLDHPSCRLLYTNSSSARRSASFNYPSTRVSANASAAQPSSSSRGPTSDAVPHPSSLPQVSVAPANLKSEASGSVVVDTPQSQHSKQGDLLEASIHGSIPRETGDEAANEGQPLCDAASDDVIAAALNKSDFAGDGVASLSSESPYPTHTTYSSGSATAHLRDAGGSSELGLDAFWSSVDRDCSFCSGSNTPFAVPTPSSQQPTPTLSIACSLASDQLLQVPDSQRALHANMPEHMQHSTAVHRTVKMGRPNASLLDLCESDTKRNISRMMVDCSQPMARAASDTSLSTISAAHAATHADNGAAIHAQQSQAGSYAYVPHTRFDGVITGDAASPAHAGFAIELLNESKQQGGKIKRLLHRSLKSAPDLTKLDKSQCTVSAAAADSEQAAWRVGTAVANGGHEKHSQQSRDAGGLGIMHRRAFSEGMGSGPGSEIGLKQGSVLPGFDQFQTELVGRLRNVHDTQSGLAQSTMQQNAQHLAALTEKLRFGTLAPGDTLARVSDTLDIASLAACRTVSMESVDLFTFAKEAAQAIRLEQAVLMPDLQSSVVSPFEKMATVEDGAVAAANSALPPRPPSASTLVSTSSAPPPTARSHAAAAAQLRNSASVSVAAVQKNIPHVMPLLPGRPLVLTLPGRMLPTPAVDSWVVPVHEHEPSSVVAHCLASQQYHDEVANRISAITLATHKASRHVRNASSLAGDRDMLSMGTPTTASQDGGGQQRAAAADAAPPFAHGSRHSVSAASGSPHAGSHAAEAAATAAVCAADDVSRAHDVSDTFDAVVMSSEQCHIQSQFQDESGTAKFQVVTYYAAQFHELRQACVVGGNAAFLASICRCCRWHSRGGKSKSYFAKTKDDRFVFKQVSKSEKQSFLNFGPAYFKYVASGLQSGHPTCLTKILGFYQVSVKIAGDAVASGRHSRGVEYTIDLVVTENIFYGKSIRRIYDLKGSMRSRFNAEAAADPSDVTAVLLDENLVSSNAMEPILVNHASLRHLERALWHDTTFLAGLGVMDYSLLLGFNAESQQLVVGVIDYIRQYTWDKQVETWVKSSGILGGSGKEPTVISPKQYCRRFRVAIMSYFVAVPDAEEPAQPLDPDMDL